MKPASGARALLLAACLLLWAAPAPAEEGAAAASPAPGEVLPEGASPAAAAEPDPLFDEDYELGPEVYDPFETGNRAVLRFNQALDRVVWDPLTRGYRFVVPDPARRCVRRAFFNFNAPVYMMNHLLQGHPLDAAETFGAFLVNSTFGLGGLFDAGEAAGFSMRAADFGQTLAGYGVGAGPYLMFPIFGPSTLRDGFGGLVDRAMHPMTYFLGIVPTQLIYDGGAGLTRREAVADEMRALEESSLDYYAVLRSAYLQARARELERPDEGTDTPSVATTDL